MARTLLPENQLSQIVQGKLNDNDAYLNETIAIAPSDYKYSLKESSFKVSFPETNGQPTTYLTLSLFDGTSYVESRRLLKETLDGITFTDLSPNTLKVGMAYEIFREDALNIYYRYLKSDVEDLEISQSVTFDTGRAMLVTNLSNGESVSTELTQNLSDTSYWVGNLSQFTTASNKYGFAVQPTGANNTYADVDITAIMDGITRTGADLQCIIGLDDQGRPEKPLKMFYKADGTNATAMSFVNKVMGIAPDVDGNVIIPIATETTDGLLSADDKMNLEKMYNAMSSINAKVEQTVTTYIYCDSTLSTADRINFIGWTDSFLKIAQFNKTSFTGVMQNHVTQANSGTWGANVYSSTYTNYPLSEGITAFNQFESTLYGGYAGGVCLKTHTMAESDSSGNLQYMGTARHGSLKIYDVSNFSLDADNSGTYPVDLVISVASSREISLSTTPFTLTHLEKRNGVVKGNKIYNNQFVSPAQKAEFEENGVSLLFMQMDNETIPE